LNSSAKRILKTWFPSAIWLAIIAVESTDLGSAYHTGRILYPLFHFLFQIDPLHFAQWHMLLRKAGHFVGYFTLSALLFRSWRATFPRLSTRWCFQWATLAFFVTALVSALDEWHQTYLPSRTGALHDVMLDSVAGLVAQVLIYAVLRALTKRNQETAYPEPYK
jgi:VanZ family protein